MYYFRDTSKNYLLLAENIIICLYLMILVLTNYENGIELISQHFILHFNIEILDLKQNIPPSWIEVLFTALNCSHQKALEDEDHIKASPLSCKEYAEEIHLPIKIITFAEVYPFAQYQGQN